MANTIEIAMLKAEMKADGPLVSQCVVDSMARSPEIREAFLKDYSIWDAEQKWFPYFVGWLSCRISQMDAAKVKK